ncbi:MAG: ATP-binding cassette domain-containing protein [Bacteroidales bacterium]|nr:MAG: ATP-binding cassette domain-containing protein [Bacteroidales bacterium]
MNESMLNALLQFLAIIQNLKRDEKQLLTRKYIENYLKKSFGKKVANEKIEVYIKYAALFKENSDFRNQLTYVCRSINQECNLREKYQILINLLDFILYSEISFHNIFSIEKPFKVFVNTIALELKINKTEFLNLIRYIFGEIYKIPQKKQLLIVGNQDPSIEEVKFLQNDHLNGYLIFLHLSGSNLLLFRYRGSLTLEINKQVIFSRRVYTLKNGSFISGKNLKPIYYGDILRAYSYDEAIHDIHYQAHEIEYKFPNEVTAIQQLSFDARSGELIGIMGGSGAGKSTLINVLCGNYKPCNGRIEINGLPLDSENENLKSIIGIVPQEDSLIEELTVYQNILFSSKLTLGNLTDDEIHKRVESTLLEFDLYSIKELKVGSPLKKLISGGQRKRLNIAMEVIRKPEILFVDEPTSGLSSLDSDNVMNLLKELSLQGTLLFINIHQPSSEIFKLFDSILILDKGGYPIFFGNPIESILYFKNKGDRVDKKEIACDYCGHINPDLIFEIVDEKQVNQYGENTNERKISPTQWHQFYLDDLKSKRNTQRNGPIPERKFQKPSSFKQLKLFFHRTVLTKLGDWEFIILSASIAPIIGFLVAFFTKQFATTKSGTYEYILFENSNVPAYFFMAIISALFIGLIVSAEGIIRDNRMLKREAFFNLSMFSYYNSKVIFFFILSAFQSFFLAIFGVLLFKIPDFTLSFWLILFSLSFLANLMGLIVSASLKSVPAIYVIVPFLLIPQILFSGVVVKFDQLNYKVGDQDKVPIIGEVMASRWAFEALTVRQFNDNEYQKNFTDVNTQESVNRIQLFYIIPMVTEAIEDYNVKTDETLRRKDIKLIKNGLAILEISNQAPNQDDKLIVMAKANLEKKRKQASAALDKIRFRKDLILENLSLTYGGEEGVTALKQKSVNKAVSDLVQNRSVTDQVIQVESEIYIKSDPIFRLAQSRIGRSHFFASFKRIGNYTIETYWFNLISIWFMIIILYIILVFELFTKFTKRYQRFYQQYFKNRITFNS